MTSDNPHLDLEQIDALLAGGLSDAERAAAAAHLADCPACTAALTAATAADRKVRTMLTPAHPAAGFEDRLIHAVRGASSRRLIAPPAVRRAALAAAAAIVVAATGAIGTNALNGHGFPWQAASLREFASSNLRQRGQALVLDSKDAPVSALAEQTPAAGTLDNAIQPLESAAVERRTNGSFAAKKLDLPPTPAPAVAPGFRPADLSATSDRDLLSSGGDARAEAQKALPGGGRATALADEVAAAPPSAPVEITAEPANKPVASLGVVVPAPPVPAAPAQPPATSPATAMVIRNGTMEFEVDRFDTAVATLTKIVQQAGGFVATTNSDTLPNGKVKGLVVLRVAPDRLDGLVQSLRALGDLKSQQITADDVTKQYTDLQAELTADHAMQDRLLELIKSGNGQIKDLLSVEKELAVWKGKIEKAEGEIRYYDNLVAMSTLTITLVERDIQTPATILETETADLGIESQDVEHGYAEALAAIKAAGGRIIESELKHLGGGQLAARIVADVPPDASGPAIDRLKELGRVARMQMHVQESSAAPVNVAATSNTSDDAAPPEAPAASGGAAPVAKQQPTRVLLSIYNLANVAPRRTTTLTVACSDVKTATTSLLDRASDLGGRIVSSQVNWDDPSRATATITLEVPPDKSAAATTAIDGLGDVLKLATAQSSDTQNTTDAKQGIVLQLVSMASTTPRETVQQTIASPDVRAAYRDILAGAAGSGAIVRSAQLDESDPQNVTATLEFQLQRERSGALDSAMGDAGQTVARSSVRADASENTADSELGVKITLSQADKLAPRETTALQLQVADATKAVASAQAIALAGGGQVTAATISKDAAGQETGKVSFDLPMEKSADALTQLRAAGTLVTIDASHDPSAPAGRLARAHVDVTYTTGNTLLASNTGIIATLRNGLATSIAGLLWSLQMLVVGLCLIVPWVAVMGIGWKMWRRFRGRAAV